MTTRCDNASDSLCPAGWRLPVAQDSANTAASREWNALLAAEGIASSPTGDGYTTNGFNNIRISPLWLARSGSVYGGSLSTGGGGGYWSSTVGGSSVAYQLYFYSGGVDPTSGNSRHYGYSIRCVAE